MKFAGQITNTTEGERQAPLKSLRLSGDEWRLFQTASDKLRRDFENKAARGKHASLSQGRSGAKRSNYTKRQQERRQKLFSLWKLIAEKEPQKNGCFRLNSAEAELFRFAEEEIADKLKKAKQRTNKLKELGIKPTLETARKGGQALKGMTGKGRGRVGRKLDPNPSPAALAKRRQRERDAALSVNGEN